MEQIRKIILTTYICIAVLSLVSCEKEAEEISLEDNLLLGHWINPVYEDDQVSFERTTSLKNDQYGISFYENHKVIERHSGFCGTPPLSFSSYEGLWEQNGNNVLIDMGEEIFNKNFSILELNAKSLKVQVNRP